MLQRVTTTDEPVRVLLLADSAVWNAQIEAARKEVDRELEGATESKDFIDDVIKCVRATSGEHAEVVRVLSSLSDGARKMLGDVLTEEQHNGAQERLSEAMRSEDMRQGLAYLRAHGAVAMYRESSNIEDLLDANPEGATWATIKGLSREEIRQAEKAAGPRPRMGAMLNAQALDVARKAARTQEDSGLAYAQHISGLTVEQQIAVEDYEQWADRVDVEVFRRSVCSIDGFDLERASDGYPVEMFIDECVESAEVVTELARHGRQVGRLGKLKA